MDNFSNGNEMYNLKFKSGLKVHYAEYQSSFERNEIGGLGYLLRRLDILLLKHLNSTRKFSKHIGHNVGYKYTSFDYSGFILNTQACTFGLFIEDVTKRGEELNSLFGKHTVDYGVVVLLKVPSGRIVLKTFPTKGTNIRASVCPFTNWVPKGGVIKFNPERKLYDIGHFEQSNDKSHVITPIYMGDFDLNFFLCGYLIQPNLPRIKIGYGIKIDGPDTSHQKRIHPLRSELNCKKYDDVGKLYVYGYMERDTNYMKRVFMERIEPNLYKDYKFYSEQTLIFYDRIKLEGDVKSDKPHRKLGKEHIERRPVCTRKTSNNVKAMLIPTLASLDDVERISNTKTYYLFVNESNINRKISVKCLTKVKNDNFKHFDHFYSRAANISVINTKYVDNPKGFASTEIEFSDKLDGFGIYTCIATDKTKAYNEKNITIATTYMLPVNGYKFTLGGIASNEKYLNFTTCKRTYDKWGKIISMNLASEGSTDGNIFIKDVSNNNEDIMIKDNMVAYMHLFNFTRIHVTCTYETIIKTTFATEQIYQFPLISHNITNRINNVKKNGNKIDDIHLYWIGAFCITAMILIAIIASIYIMRKGRVKSGGTNGSKKSAKGSGKDVKGPKKTAKGNKKTAKTTLGGKSSMSGSIASDMSKSGTSVSNTSASGISTSIVPNNKKVTTGKKIANNKKPDPKSKTNTKSSDTKGKSPLKGFFKLKKKK
uniref:Ig-like domain-containing protein n=1 Tax=Parastrongyloides trichosuri TaxID=131310 RepID=A0A0N4ZZA9_PARTI